MARNRTISPDFWTWEAVIDCQPMTRLLFIGLWNFADDFGVQPLRPRTIRMQVFPGDTIENERVRAMLDELAAQGLVRIYEVDGQEYVAIADWDQLQRVGKRARRRYPAAASAVPGVGEASEQPPSQTMANHRIGETSGQTPATIANHRIDGAPPPRPEKEGEPQQWRRRVKDLLHAYWPRHAVIESVDDETADRWTAKWIAEGCDYGRDIVPAVRDFYVMQPDRPPADWRELDARLRRTAAPA